VIVRRYAGQPDAMIDYELSNRQKDEYPAAWAYPREDEVTSPNDG
jgi:hypothetical protein